MHHYLVSQHDRKKDGTLRQRTTGSPLFVVTAYEQIDVETALRRAAREWLATPMGRAEQAIGGIERRDLSLDEALMRIPPYFFARQSIRSIELLPINRVRIPANEPIATMKEDN